MSKYFTRITTSARGEVFNPLLWPFLLTTLVYGLSFVAFLPLGISVGGSELFTTFAALGAAVPIIWGILAIATILGGLTFLLFNIPPYGKVSGILGFMLWLFVAISYTTAGDFLLLFAVAIPNMWFWIWQYLSLSRFRDEESRDKNTMSVYDHGGYDDENPEIDSRQARLDNRGVHEQ